MKCPFCGSADTQVIDSRVSEPGDSIRRRRRCAACQKRFTTYETVELRLPQVVKTNGTRSDFDIGKLRNGFQRALHKRPVPTEFVDQAVDRIVGQVLSLGEREIASRQIGEMVMQELYKLDKVAYIRFASVYRSFQDVDGLPRRGARSRERRCTAPAHAGAAGPDAMIGYTDADRAHMARALALAARGLYTTTPNPRVGCVIVADGADNRRGLPRARRRGARRGQRACRRRVERGNDPRGATLYVTLEPCNHTGRTPPCTDALIAAGVARGSSPRCPIPIRCGARRRRGCARPGSRSTSVSSEREARELNIGFVSRMTRGRPWVRMKVAASLDGRTALANGESQWITGRRRRAPTGIAGARARARC